MRRIDLTGRRFGRLEVIERDALNPSYVICRCECGTICKVKAYSLTSNQTRSCGCIRRETSSATGKRTIMANNIHNDVANKKFNVIFQRIESHTINKNNHTGHRGVWYNPATQKYRAYIGLRGRLIVLGNYKTLDEAVAARADGEEKYYAPLIEQKNEFLASLNVQL